tara:strand:+ start:680 stop:1408 length:729 start_codon:yes stop_codon:yes gene_type:complete
VSPPTTPVVEAIQGPQIAGVLELFELDVSVIAAGQPVIRFVSAVAVDNVIQRGGVGFMPTPIETEGFDQGGTGAVPQPTITVGDLTGQIGPWVWASQDLLGATLTRTLVLRENMDDGADPDPSVSIGPPSLFKVAQKLSQTSSEVTFRLVAEIDQGEQKLPRRQVFKDSCLRRYRVWNSATSTFDYAAADCPYNGAALFDITDQTTTIEGVDQCSRKISGCRLRFPGAPLPTTAFPGVGARR